MNIMITNPLYNSSLESWFWVPTQNQLSKLWVDYLMRNEMIIGEGGDTSY